MPEKYCTYKEATEIVKELNIKSSKDYRDRYKENIKLPSSPQTTYKNSGWIDWSNFLGKTSIYHVKKLNYADALKFILQYNITTREEYEALVKSHRQLPSNPNKHYKNSGWIDWPTFLNRPKYIVFAKKKDSSSYLSYEDAKELTQRYFQDKKASVRNYRLYANEVDNLPLNPQFVYKDKGWINWKIFLGETHKIRVKNKSYLTFEEAKKLLRELKISYHKDYIKLIEEKGEILKLPYNPDRIYKNDGWISWNDFLDLKNKEMYTYEMAKNFMHINNFWRTEHYKLAQRDNKKKLPRDPEIYYAEEWEGWEIFLAPCMDGKYSFEKAKERIKELKITNQKQYRAILQKDNKFHNSPSLRYEFKWKGWNDYFGIEEEQPKTLDFISKNISDLIKLDNTSFAIFLIQSGQADKYLDNIRLDSLFKLDDIRERNKILLGFLHNQHENISGYNQTDLYKETKTNISNIEGIELHNYRLALNEYLNGQQVLESEKYNENIIIKLKSQIKECDNTQIPSTYAYKDAEGNLLQPNVMQLITANSLKKYNSFGNWSSQGSGKSISAILASRLNYCNITLIICNNSTIEGWSNEITNSFTDNEYFVGDNENIDKFKPSQDKASFIIINYEKLQISTAAEFISKITKFHVDMIILDEIQNIKDGSFYESQRRINIKRLNKDIKDKNPDLKLLVMTATPVINNLKEAASILEFIYQDEIEISTENTLENALAIYTLFNQRGIRFLKVNTIQTNEIPLVFNGNDLEYDIRECKSILELERILINKKMSEIVPLLSKGTILYTYYIDETVQIIEKYLNENGFSYAVHTGEEKKDLDKFLKGEVEILVCSSTLSVGFNGLQKVSNNLFLLSLMWTYAEYEHLIARIARQGSNFEKANVFIPKIKLEIGEQTWSWDEGRYQRLMYKKTLANTAIDGIIPEGRILNRNQFLTESLQALKQISNKKEAEV